MAKILTIPPGTPYSKKDYEFNLLWQYANGAAGADRRGEVKAIGGYRLSVPDDVAAALSPEGAEPPAEIPAEPEAPKAPVKKAPAKKAAAKKAPAKKKSPARKATARKRS